MAGHCLCWLLHVLTHPDRQQCLFSSLQPSLQAGSQLLVLHLAFKEQSACALITTLHALSLDEMVPMQSSCLRQTPPYSGSVSMAHLNVNANHALVMQTAMWGCSRATSRACGAMQGVSGGGACAACPAQGRRWSRASSGADPSDQGLCTHTQGWLVAQGAHPHSTASLSCSWVA